MTDCSPSATYLPLPTTYYFVYHENGRLISIDSSKADAEKSICASCQFAEEQGWPKYANNASYHYVIIATDENFLIDGKMCYLDSKYSERQQSE